MFMFDAYLWGLAAVLLAGVVTWLISLVKQDVSIVDTLWPSMFIIAAWVYATAIPQPGPRTTLLLILVNLWALRLAGYITWRNWGEPEDRRYQEIRRRHEPNFTHKSLYLIFGLQAFLAWIISLPLLGGIAAPSPVSLLDGVGVLLWLTGMAFEAGGDYQLARFKADPANRGKVMDRGLWRYTRHPNYFGDFCLWWGFYLIALAGGAWWSIVSPLLMSFFLLKVSGVALLEEDIGERRPAYRDYMARTNAFFPGPPR
jgi:steroid 5-alpha reductase family enzyme